MSDYQRENRKHEYLDYECISCLQNLERQKDKLLEFVKWCKDTSSCHACEHQSMLAAKLLKEIGEINE